MFTEVDNGKKIYVCEQRMMASYIIAAHKHGKRALLSFEVGTKAKKMFLQVSCNSPLWRSVGIATIIRSARIRTREVDCLIMLFLNFFSQTNFIYTP